MEQGHLARLLSSAYIVGPVKGVENHGRKGEQDTQMYSALN